MTEELGPEPHELQEQVLEAVEEVKGELTKEKAKEQKERQWLNLIGLSTAILSALAAVSSMQGGYLANEGMLAQIRASDQWQLFQAKSTKRHVEESTVTLLQSLQKPIPARVTAALSKLQTEQQEIQAAAQKLQEESQEHLHRHELFARSVAALQIGISLGAVAALLRRPLVWYLGLGIAVIGIVFMIMGTLPTESNLHAPGQPVNSQF
jgi:YesN/AraC family two-component response regulator